MDALKAAILQAEEDSHMRHTPLRQAFNALKNLQLQGGGGQIDRDNVDKALQCFRKSMYVSTDTSFMRSSASAPYVDAASGEGKGELTLPIGNLTWEEFGANMIKFTLTQVEGRHADNLKERGSGDISQDTHTMFTSTPWSGQGFTPLEFEYSLSPTRTQKIFVNVYCRMTELAAAMTEACGASTD